MASLTVMDGPLKGQRISLEYPLTRVGRREGNDWVLQDGSVSGSHCEIEMSDSGLLVRDLGSTNGTKVNNHPIKDKQLFRNDILLIGEVPVMVEGEDVPQSAQTETPPIPRTTIVIPQKRPDVTTPKVFVKKSSSNKVWTAVIVLLLIVIGSLMYVFLKG